MSEAFDTLIRQTVEGAGSAMTRFCEAEAEVARHKIHVQKVWFAEKLETARVAADVRARNSGAAAVAKASKEFEKKVERMADGGVEKELMRRVQEQAAELERLGLIEEESVLSKQRLASKEAELDKAQAAARQVAEDEKLCKGLMMRKAKRDLDVELSIEADLKEVVQDFVGTFSDKSRGAMDELRKLRVQFQELSANFALVERAGAEAAAAATCLAAELEEARQAEATAVERSTALELEVGELRRQLEATDAERHALEQHVAALTARCASAEAARTEAEARAVEISRQAEKAAQAHEKQLRLATDTIGGLQEALGKARAELADFAERVGKLEETLRESESRAEAAASDLHQRDAELEAEKAESARHRALSEKLQAERDAERKALEELLAAARRQAEEAAAANMASERKAAKEAQEEAERAETSLRAELQAANQKLSKREPGSQEEESTWDTRKEKLQIRARVATTLPAGCMVLISPLTEGRGKAFGQLVERTLHKIHEGGGIKVRAMLPNGSQARASMLDSVTETADAALTPATWAMDSRDAGGRGAGGSRVPHNVAANDRSPRMGRSHRKEREVTLTAVCESRAERFSERSSAAAGGAAPALPSRSPRVDPWNVGGVACGGSGVGSMQQQHQKQQDYHHHQQQQQRQRTGLDAQLPEWGPELHEVQPQLPLGHPYPPRFDAAPAAAQGRSPRHPHRRGAAAGVRRRTNAVEEPAPWPTTTPA